MKHTKKSKTIITFDEDINGTVISDVDDFLSSLEQAWKDSWTRDNLIPIPPNDTRAEELHPSSSPFCSYRYMMDLLSYGESEYRNYPSKMEYYCEIGTIAHLVFQKTYLNEAYVAEDSDIEVKIIGDYHCKNEDCKKVYPFSYTPICPECGTHTQYEELGVRYGKRVHGHIDYIVEYNGKYYILDFKTSSVAMIQAAERCKAKGYKNPLPYPRNLFQVLSYGSYVENGALANGAKVEIEGIILLYASRDNPMQHYYFHYQAFAEYRDMLKRYIQVSDSMFDLSRKTFKAIQANKEIPTKSIENIVKYKLCKSIEDYESNYMDKYDVCPYMTSCHNNGCKKITRAIKQFNDYED